MHLSSDNNSPERSPENRPDAAASPFGQEFFASRHATNSPASQAKMRELVAPGPPGAYYNSADLSVTIVCKNRDLIRVERKESVALKHIPKIDRYQLEYAPVLSEIWFQKADQPAHQALRVYGAPVHVTLPQDKQGSCYDVDAAPEYGEKALNLLGSSLVNSLEGCSAVLGVNDHHQIILRMAQIIPIDLASNILLIVGPQRNNQIAEYLDEDMDACSRAARAALKLYSLWQADGSTNLRTVELTQTLFEGQLESTLPIVDEARCYLSKSYFLDKCFLGAGHVSTFGFQRPTHKTPNKKVTFFEVDYTNAAYIDLNDQRLSQYHIGPELLNPVIAVDHAPYSDLVLIPDTIMLLGAKLEKIRAQGAAKKA